MKTYEPLAGESITETARRIVEMADELNESVTARFNDIQLTANPGDSAYDIAEYYRTESDRRHEEWMNSPEGKQAIREQKERNRRAAAAAAEPIKLFTLKDSEAWKQAVDANQDGYGSGIIRYSARWANLMELKMSEGHKLEDIASEASHEADAEGITGFMYGAAVSILAQMWVHGEQLRRWHNLDTQIGNEGELANESGGVLNPALLSLG